MNWLPTKVSSSFTKGTPPVKQNTNHSLEDTAASFENAQFAVRDVLTEVLRTGAQQMLKEAIEREVADYIDDRKDIVDESGRRLVIRNGHLPEREIMTGWDQLLLASRVFETNDPLNSGRCSIPEFSPNTCGRQNPLKT